MKWHRIIATLVTSALIAACGPAGGPSVSSTPAAPGSPASAPRAVVVKKEIGLVMKTLTNPFFIEMEKGARRAEQEFGITLRVKTASQETSIEQQIQLVEDLIASNADAIVIAPGDSQRLIATLKKSGRRRHQNRQHRQPSGPQQRAASKNAAGAVHRR